MELIFQKTLQRNLCFDAFGPSYIIFFQIANNSEKGSGYLNYINLCHYSTRVIKFNL